MIRTNVSNDISIEDCFKMTTGISIYVYTNRVKEKTGGEENSWSLNFKEKR